MPDWGLEDKLLLQNAPGRVSVWDADPDEETEKARAGAPVSGVDDVEHEEEEEEDEEEDVFGGEIPEAMRYGEAPGSRRGGPKGQLAQYRYFKKMQYAERMAKKVEREALYVSAATGSKRRPGDPMPQDDDDDDDDDEREDDDFLKVYRTRRLEELQRTAGMPRFGHHRCQINKAAYLAAISVDPRIVVAVHLHEPTFPSSRRLEAALASLAPKRPDVSFLSITLDEAEQPFEPDLLPILVLYKDADVVDTFFRVTNDLDPLNDVADLEDIIDNSNAFCRRQEDTGGPPNGNRLRDALLRRRHDISDEGLLDDDDDDDFEDT